MSDDFNDLKGESATAPEAQDYAVIGIASSSRNLCYQSPTSTRLLRGMESDLFRETLKAYRPLRTA